MLSFEVIVGYDWRLFLGICNLLDSIKKKKETPPPKINISFYTDLKVLGIYIFYAPMLTTLT